MFQRQGVPIVLLSAQFFHSVSNSNGGQAGWPREVPEGGDRREAYETERWLSEYGASRGRLPSHWEAARGQKTRTPEGTDPEAVAFAESYGQRGRARKIYIKINFKMKFKIKILIGLQRDKM